MVKSSMQYNSLITKHSNGKIIRATEPCSSGLSRVVKYMTTFSIDSINKSEMLH